MGWTEDRDKLFTWVVIGISVIVATIDFLPDDVAIPFFDFREHIPAMILFVVAVITAILILDKRQDSKEIEGFHDRYPVEIAQGNKKVRKLGIDAIEKAEHNIKIVILGAGEYSSTNTSSVNQDFIKALEKKMENPDKPFSYQCILSYDPNEDLQKIESHINDKNKLYQKYSQSVEYRFFKEKRINLTIAIVDEQELIISFMSSDKKFFRVFKINDNKLVKPIGEWFDHLWRHAERINSLSTDRIKNCDIAEKKTSKASTNGSVRDFFTSKHWGFWQGVVAFCVAISILLKYII